MAIRCIISNSYEVLDGKYESYEFESSQQDDPNFLNCFESSNQLDLNTPLDIQTINEENLSFPNHADKQGNSDYFFELPGNKDDLGLNLESQFLNTIDHNMFNDSDFNISYIVKNQEQMNIFNNNNIYIAGLVGNQIIDDKDSNLPVKLIGGQERKIKSLKMKNKKIHKDKNIHRYITRQIIRSMLSQEFNEKVDQICSEHQIQFQDVEQYFLKEMENFINIKHLKEHWQIERNNFEKFNQIKKVFKDFSKWFLKEKAIRYILAGQMKDKKAYIEYKNKIMLRYIDQPEKYISNKVLKK